MQWTSVLALPPVALQPAHAGMDNRILANLSVFLSSLRDNYIVWHKHSLFRLLGQLANMPWLIFSNCSRSGIVMTILTYSYTLEHAHISIFSVSVTCLLTYWTTGGEMCNGCHDTTISMPYWNSRLRCCHGGLPFFAPASVSITGQTRAHQPAVACASSHIFNCSERKVSIATTTIIATAASEAEAKETLSSSNSMFSKRQYHASKLCTSMRL